MDKQKNPLGGGSSGDLGTDQINVVSKHNVPKRKSEGKLESMLRRFAEERRYHRFSAEIVGDHCLPTTISCLQRQHGIYFNRKMIRVKNRFGGESSVSLYWLNGVSLAKARRICGIESEVVA